MKKLLLVAAIAVFGMSSVNAQNFNVGLSGALPMGDAADSHTFGVNLDVNYQWEVSDVFTAGVGTGYFHYFGDEIEIMTITVKFEDAGFVPLAAVGRYKASDQLTFGADVGYALGISHEGNDGGFYYAPKVQYSVSDNIDVVASYKGISLEVGSFDAISLGIEFGL